MSTVPTQTETSLCHFSAHISTISGVHIIRHAVRHNDVLYRSFVFLKWCRHIMQVCPDGDAATLLNWRDNACHGILAMECRDYSLFGPSQWETSLQSNAVSHWLGANIELAPECMILQPDKTTGLIDESSYKYVTFPTKCSQNTS